MKLLGIKIEEVVRHLWERLLPLIPSKKRSKPKRIAFVGVTGAVVDV
jgi:hypothetical protein